MIGDVRFFSEMLVAVFLSVRGRGGENERLLFATFRGGRHRKEITGHLVQRRVFGVVELILDRPALQRPITLHQDLPSPETTNRKVQSIEGLACKPKKNRLRLCES